MSISFNNSTTKIAFPSGFFNYERTQPWTIAFWAYWTGTKSGAIFGDSVFSRLQSSSPFTGVECGFLWTGTSYTPNNKLCLYAYISNNYFSNRIDVRTTDDIPANEWHHYAFTYAGTSLASGVTAYFDGVSKTLGVDGNNLSASILNEVTPHIGCRTATTSFLNAQLQNFGAWSAELNASEVASLAKAMAPPLVRPQSLISHVPMYREIIDTKGNALTATDTSVGAQSTRIYA